MQRVIPVAALIQCWALWLVVDLIEMYFHLFDTKTPSLVADHAFWMLAMVGSTWLVSGRKISNEK